jgi:hypothetical protein
MSIIYEVNLEVDTAIASEFAEWLVPHIQEMIIFDGFKSAQWYSRQNSDENNQAPVHLWTIHYQLEDRTSYDNYVLNHAPRMRDEGILKFSGKFKATRRILNKESFYNL